MNTPRKFNVAMDEEDEIAKIAQAILETSRHVLTGMEIMILEKLAGMIDPEWNAFQLTVNDIHWFHSLQTQFSREIGKWRDRK
jgi:hypothetical protein